MYNERIVKELRRGKALLSIHCTKTSDLVKLEAALKHIWPKDLWLGTVLLSQRVKTYANELACAEGKVGERWALVEVGGGQDSYTLEGLLTSDYEGLNLVLKIDKSENNLFMSRTTVVENNKPELFDMRKIVECGINRAANKLVDRGECHHVRIESDGMSGYVANVIYYSKEVAAINLCTPDSYANVIGSETYEEALKTFAKAIKTKEVVPTIKLGVNSLDNMIKGGLDHGEATLIGGNVIKEATDKLTEELLHDVRLEEGKWYVLPPVHAPNRNFTSAIGRYEGICHKENGNYKFDMGLNFAGEWSEEFFFNKDDDTSLIKEATQEEIDRALEKHPLAVKSNPKPIFTTADGVEKFHGDAFRE